MPNYLIMCRSLTYAQRAARVLERSGITAIVTKAPQGTSTEGCAYCVKISERRLADSMHALNSVNIPTGKVFIQAGGDFQEVGL